jgi:hypothetical protein
LNFWLRIVFQADPLHTTRQDSPAANVIVVAPSICSDALGSRVMTPVPLLRTPKVNPSPAVVAASRVRLNVPLVQSISLPLSPATTP